MVDFHKSHLKWSRYIFEHASFLAQLENIDIEDNVDNNIKEEWESIKTIIKETKQPLIEKEEGRRKGRSITIKEKKLTK
jgi:hypothetical protein